MTQQPLSRRVPEREAPGNNVVASVPLAAPSLSFFDNLTIVGKRIQSAAEGRFAINPHVKGVAFK